MCVNGHYPVIEKIEPSERGETEGSHPRKRDPLLRLRAHERESLPAGQGPLRTRVCSTQCVSLLCSIISVARLVLILD